MYGQLKAILLDKKWERESRIKYYKKRQKIMMKVNLFFDANQLVHHNCSKLIDTLRRSNASRWKQHLDRNKNRKEAWGEKKRSRGWVVYSATRLADLWKWMTHFLTKVAGIFGDILKKSRCSKNCFGHFLGHFWKNWATFLHLAALVVLKDKM